MNEKRRPHHALSDIKAAFADPKRLNRSFSSRQGADALGLNDTDLVAMIARLGVLEFEKSMTSYVDHTIWQDVYKPLVDGRTAYVKFTLDAMGQLFLISCKEA